MTQNEIESDLNSRIASFRGYQTLARFEVRENDITPNGWVPHITLDEIHNTAFSKGFVKPFGFMEVLERISHLDESHGPKRLAILFLGADGIATYDALFCQGSAKPPFAVIIQEHGTGGNHDAFGKGSLLELISKRTTTFPEFLLVSQNGEAWDGYSEVIGLTATRGGEHNMERSLFKRIR